MSEKTTPTTCTFCGREDIPTAPRKAGGRKIRQHREVRTDPNSSHCIGTGYPVE